MSSTSRLEGRQNRCGVLALPTIPKPNIAVVGQIQPPPSVLKVYRDPAPIKDIVLWQNGEPKMLSDMHLNVKA